MLQREHTKRIRYYFVDFQMNTYSFLLPFFERENETFKKLGRWEQNFIKYMEKIKSGEDKV